MDDLISRRAAIEALIELYEYQRDIDPTEAADLVRQGIYLAEKKIEPMPSAQPERKKGEWLPDNRPDGGFWVCSECKFPSEAFAANVLYKFCPNCGAKMDGGEQDG